MGSCFFKIAKIALVLGLLCFSGASAFGAEDAVDPESIKVSILMPVYNNVQDIDRAVDSILGQTHKNLEIFVADDHSTDGVFEHLAAKYNDSRLHVIRVSKNSGRYALDNFVLKNFVTGQYVTWQDSDDFSAPTRIEKQLNYSLAHQLGATAIPWREVNSDGAEKDIMTAYPRERDPTPIRPVIEHMFWENKNLTVLPGKALYKTDEVMALGGFDGTQRFGDDVMFNSRFMRIFRTGSLSKDDPLYYWVRREGSLTTSKKTGLLSWPRLKKLLFISTEKRNRLNWLYRTGNFKGYVDRVVDKLFYPPELHVEKYHGAGLPQGNYRDFDPRSEENLKQVLGRVLEDREKANSCASFFDRLTGW